MCPNAGSSDPQTDAWTAIYGAPIAERLNTQAPGANVVAADISNLIPLCAFETLVKHTTSPFCALFTPAEFAQFEYFADLDKYYGTGSVQQFHIVSNLGDRFTDMARPWVLFKVSVTSTNSSHALQESQLATIPKQIER